MQADFDRLNTEAVLRDCYGRTRLGDWQVGVTGAGLQTDYLQPSRPLDI